MGFRNLKDFQKRLANSAMSRYAEAILAISAVAQSIVSSVGRTIQQYASVRNSIQLVTTNEDDEFVDETTPDREVIADSVFVQAWQNIATAVERLISLRRDLSSEGATADITTYPSKINKLEVVNTLPVITPKVSNPDLANGGYIYFPSSYLEGEGTARKVRLSPMPFSGKFDGVSFELLNSTLDFQKGEQFAYNDGFQWTGTRFPTLGSGQSVLTAVMTIGANSTALEPVIESVHVLRCDGSAFTYGTLNIRDLSFGSPVTGMTQLTFNYASFSAFTGAITASGVGEAVPTTDMAEVVSQRLILQTDEPPSEEVTLDPLDPYSVFSQAYDAADVLVEFLDEIGYPTGLSSSDKQLLKEQLP